MKSALRISVALCALAGAVPVSAQTAQTGAESDSGIGDIIVTAQRREETAQKAAIAIDAVSGASLIDAGILKAEDLSLIHI